MKVFITVIVTGRTQKDHDRIQCASIDEAFEVVADLPPGQVSALVEMQHGDFVHTFDPSCGKYRAPKDMPA